MADLTSSTSPLCSRPPSLARRVLALALVASLVVPMQAHASIFGEESAALTTLVGQGFDELGQFGTMITTAKQNLDMLRDIYAGVGEFVNFDPQAFLEEQQQIWLSQLPIAGDVKAFGEDVITNGVKGGKFSSKDLASRFDAYRDARRKSEAQENLGGDVRPYDARTALTVAGEAQRTLTNPSARASLAKKAETATASEGLFSIDASRADPQLLGLYMQRRASAKEAEFQAFKLYSESLGASPGKAQQLAAMATSLSAQELARIDDKLAISTSVQQLDRQEKALDKASSLRESEYLWDDVKRASKSFLAPPERGDIEFHGAQ